MPLRRVLTLAAAWQAALAFAAPAAAPMAYPPLPDKWVAEGRDLPEPELLQPRLDPALPPYRACAGAPPSGRLQGVAPTILPQLAARWTAAFAQVQPGVRVSVPAPYLAPQGIESPPLQRFLDAQGGDFAFITRDVAVADVVAFRRAHGHDMLTLPVVAGAWRHFGFIDAMGVIVHRSNPVQGLSYAQLDALFSTSRLRGHAPVVTWGDLGVAAWADKPVHVVGSAGWMGAESARAVSFRDAVLKSGSGTPVWRRDVPVRGTEADVPEQVGADPLAIGFTGMGHLVPEVKTIGLALRDGEPFIEPSYENVALARYPFSRVGYLAIDHVPGQPLKPALREFVRFLLSREGQQAVRDQGVFLPLRASQVQAALQRLEPAGQNGCPAP